MARFVRMRFMFVATLLLVAQASGQPAAAMQAAASSNRQFVGGRDGLSLWLGASVGTVAGTAYERVYIPEVHEGYKGSELVWDIEGIVLAGAQGTIGYGRRFRVNFGLWSAMNEGTGSMVDYDWLYVGRDWSDRSEHPDTIVDTATLFDLNLDVLVFRRGPLSLRGVLGYKGQTWKWEARGGTYVYSDLENDGFRDLRGSFPDGQLGIVYEQKYRVPYAGLGVAGEWTRFCIAGYAFYSPWASAGDVDDHVLRETVFTGTFSGGTYLGVGASGTWRVVPRLSLTLTLQSEALSEIVGDIVIDAPEGRFASSGGGSVEISTVSLALAAAYRF